jgi:cupin fold WbuC family metalloprotein
MNLRRLSPDVYLTDGPIAVVGAAEVALLSEAVDASSRGRVRINMHPNGDDPLHDMLIAIRPDSYIRPHKHPGKSETFHIVQGAVDVVIFDDAGDIRQIVELAANDPNRAFCYRMSEPMFHTLVIRSDLLIVHEITNGPFKPEGTVFAAFAPPDTDTPAAEAYQGLLLSRLAERPPA